MNKKKLKETKNKLEQDGTFGHSAIVYFLICVIDALLEEK